MQAILKKTGERLCESIALDWNVDSLFDLELSVSLGFDSTAGHLNPHQKSKKQDYDFTVLSNHSLQMFLILTIVSG